MDNNKKKIIIVISLLVVVILGTILTIVLLNKSNTKTMTTEEKNIYEGLAYIENTSLITEHQKKLEEEYIKTFKEGNYSFSNPYVVTNPYEVAPLSALIMFETESATSGKVTIKAKENGTDLVFEFEENKTHYIAIWGLYENYNNKVVIETSDGNKKELDINTVTNDTFNRVLIDTIDNPTKINEFFLIDTPIGTSFNLIDSLGNVRVKFQNQISKFIKQLDNSHILISDGNIDMEGLAYGILEMDLTGKVYNYYKLDYGMSYGSVVLENGNILYMSQNQNELETFDTIIEIDKEGNFVRTIDIYELMKKIDSTFMESIKDKWGYISGIDYNKESDELLVSLWYSSAVIGLDYKSGNINWILSNPTNLSANYASYLLNPSDVNFEYPKGAYAVANTNEGFSLMVTNWDLSDSYSCSSVVGRKSYVANYKLDRTNKTISEVSSFGKDKNYFSYALGDYNHYDKYDLALFGREFYNANYSDPGCVVNDFWDLYSKLLLIDNDGNVKYDATIKSPNVIAQIYNVNKKINNKFIDGKTYNFKFKENLEEKLNYKDYSEKIKNATTTNYSLMLKENKLTTNATSGEKLVLVSADNNIYRYEYKTEGISNYYALNTHNDYFKVFVEKDGVLYNTGTYLYI